MAKLKLEYEEIPQTDHQSYRILTEVRLNDFYYWHFHPEIELVYINAQSGLRHVGDHLSTYTNGDLVLIGSGIPHLNFDFLSKGKYDMIVIHLRSDFLENALGSAPEYGSIRSLLDRSKYGICFSEAMRHSIESQMLKLDQSKGLDRFFNILKILHQLSTDDGQTLLHSTPYKEVINQRERDRLNSLYHFIDHHYNEKITISDAAKVVHLSNEAFCRFFKKMTRLTFTEFLNHYRINQSKRFLIQGQSVSATAYLCGYESIYYYSKVFKRVTGMSPTHFVASLP